MYHSTIGVILPTYNRARYILETLGSIISQTRPVDRILIIDDGSTDNTLEVLKTINDSRITVISKPNGGKSSALNMAMPMMDTDYIWIADDDDIAYPNAMETLAGILDANPDTGMAMGRLIAFNDADKNRKLYDTTYLPRTNEPNNKIHFLETMFTNQFATLTRLSLYQEVGPYCEDLVRSEDIDMVIRLTRHAKSIFVPEYIFMYRQHSGLRGSEQDRFKAEDNAKKWQHYGQTIYTNIRGNYSLEEFCPTFALDWEDSSRKRACLLQRGLIFANQSMWKEALEDLAAASQLNSNQITGEEVALAGTVIVYDMPWKLLGENKLWIKALSTIYRETPNGHKIVFAILQRLYRQIARQLLKKRDINGACKSAQLLIKILGVSGAAKRIIASPF